jgi:hypothetical protein
VHGDLWGGNILADANRVGVIDWNHFHFGTPLEDLFNFAAAMAFRRFRDDPAREARAVGRAFYGGSALARRPQAAAMRLLQRLGADQDAMQPLFTAFLLSRLVKREFDNAEMWREFVRLFVEGGESRVFGPGEGPVVAVN